MLTRIASYVLALTLLSAGTIDAQEKGRWGVGLDIGGVKLYGDRSSTSFGLGLGGFLSYRALEFADFALSLGYGQLRYDILPNVTNTTNMITADVKGTFELVSTGPFRPYLSAGLGVLSFQVNNSGFGRFFDGQIFGGGGFRVRVSPDFEWLVGVDYRLITGDSVDNLALSKEGDANDGYLNLRTGFSYYFPSASTSSEDFYVDSRAPLYEVADGDYQNPPVVSEAENKDMEEYVRLKSRIDQLSQDVDSQEGEVARLQSELSQRQRSVTSLESQASNTRPVRRASNSSLSGFSDIYEEALTNFYNKNYDEAVSLFRVLIEKYPNHSLASNYQFWLGQSLLALNRHQEAIASFYKVMNYDRSLKKDDALFLLGKTYLQIGSGESAKESFARLVREYPSSEFVVEAEGYLRKL